MARYDEAFKRAVVQQYLTGHDGFRALAPKYGVDQSTIRKWVGIYRQHSDAGLSRKTQGVYYSAQFKLPALKCMRREELTYRQATAVFNLRGGTVVIAGVS